MKKRDILLIALLLAIGLVLFILTRRPDATESAVLKITVNGSVYGEYPIDEDQTIKINDTNVCQIKNGEVSMTSATCPDKICVNTAAIHSDLGSIVCLPNKVVLEIVEPDTPASADSSADDEPDVVAH